MRLILASTALVITVALAGCSQAGTPSEGASGETTPAAQPAQPSQILEPAREAEDAAVDANQAIQQQQDAVQELEGQQ
jgi:outer membrane murein-binding lipoprotein Lpp